MKSARVVFAFLAVCTGWAAGQTSALRGPWLGMLSDPESGSLRPLRGFPGAATLGPALSLPAQLDLVRASQRAGFALGIDRKDGSVVEVTASVARKLTAVAPAPDEIAFSPAGTRAALFYSGQGEVHVFSGFPSTPMRTATLNFATLPGPLAALAVSDDGLVLAACSTGAGSSVIYGAEKLKPVAAAVFTARRVSALAFLGASRDALVADAAADVVYRLRNTSGVAVAAAADGVSQPVALASSADGSRAVVANSGAAPLLVLDFESGRHSTFACPCRTVAAEPLAGNAVFRLTAPGASQLWLLDAERPDPRLFFVPQTEAQ